MKEIDLRSVLHHGLTEYPFALASEDSVIALTDQSKLADLVPKSSENYMVNSIIADAAIIDGRFLYPKQINIPSTSGALYFKRVLQLTIAIADKFSSAWVDFCA